MSGDILLLPYTPSRRGKGIIWLAETYREDLFSKQRGMTSELASIRSASRFVSWDSTAGLLVTSAVNLSLSLSLSLSLTHTHTTNDALTQPLHNFPSLFFSHTGAYTVLNVTGHFQVTHISVSDLQ
jgi:hypothetical protein